MRLATRFLPAPLLPGRLSMLFEDREQVVGMLGDQILDGPRHSGLD
ncbi:hypothetical protein [Streptomyces atratus]|nr:hypothetical protein [Streptomyces atratus]MCX5345761.1 hypothetical protein [Streptomyces atratus]